MTQTINKFVGKWASQLRALLSWKRGLVRVGERRALRAVAVANMLAVGVGAASAAQFNFSYQFGGERRILPLQVFDDGINTYFQFRQSNSVVPVILAEASGQSYVANYSVYGPYVVVPGVAASYRLKYGVLEANIVQSGGRQPVAVPTPENPAAAAPVIALASTVDARPVATRYVGYGPVNPVLGGAVTAVVQQGRSGTADIAGIVGGSPATFRVPFAMDSAKLSPAAMKAISEALRGGDEIGSVTVIGRDDPNYKDGVAADRARALAVALVRYGVSEGRITQRVGIPREDDKPKLPTSDLVITRVAARVPAAAPVLAQQDHAAAAPAPSGVAAALASIRAGLSSLIRLGWLSQGRADAALEVINGGGSRAQAPAVEPTQALARVPAAPTGGAMAAADEVWTMTPADGTAIAGLSKWAARAGWLFESRTDVDYPITGVITARGDARAAVRHVENLLKGKKRPLRWHMEDNKLVIEG